MADEKLEPKLFIPVLEEASSAEPSSFEGRNMLSDSGLSTTLVQSQFLENALTLLTQNCSYQDFSRDLLLLIVRAVKCEAASILECDYTKENYFFRASTGSSSDRLPDFTIPFGQGIVGHVCETRQLQHVSDAQADLKHHKVVQHAVQFSPRNIVAAPIVIRGKVYAVVEFLNRVGAEDFTAEDLEICTTLSRLAARVIEVRMMLAHTGVVAKKVA